MTLTDAGPLVALIDPDEPDHDRCVAALRTLSHPLVTTWPAFTEAMYLLGKFSGWRGQEALWRVATRDDVEIATIDEQLLSRVRDLMESYRDLPMDLADATLVAIAEQRQTSRIFTLDGDFRRYRLPGRRRFEIVP